MKRPEINNKLKDEEITPKADELYDLSVENEKAGQANGGLSRSGTDVHGHGTHVAGTIGSE